MPVRVALKLGVPALRRLLAFGGRPDNLLEAKDIDVATRSWTSATSLPTRDVVAFLVNETDVPLSRVRFLTKEQWNAPGYLVTQVR
jgi:hypothetical protein